MGAEIHSSDSETSITSSTLFSNNDESLMLRVKERDLRLGKGLKDEESV